MAFGFTTTGFWKGVRGRLVEHSVSARSAHGFRLAAAIPGPETTLPASLFTSAAARKLHDYQSRSQISLAHKGRAENC